MEILLFISLYGVAELCNAYNPAASSPIAGWLIYYLSPSNSFPFNS